MTFTNNQLFEILPNCDSAEELKIISWLIHYAYFRDARNEDELKGLFGDKFSDHQTLKRLILHEV